MTTLTFTILIILLIVAGSVSLYRYNKINKFYKINLKGIRYQDISELELILLKQNAYNKFKNYLDIKYPNINFNIGVWEHFENKVPMFKMRCEAIELINNKETKNKVKVEYCFTNLAKNK